MHANTEVLITIVVAATFGVLTQVLAHRWHIPAIVLLLALGVLLGPEALGLVQPDLLDGGLNILVKLAVAIVLFEGALNLRLSELRRALREVRNLVTLGVLLSWSFTTLIAHWVAGMDWPLAILFGALMTVTGPTVVQPLLKRVHVPKKIKTILEGEAVLVDPIGAILAVVVLEFLLHEGTPLFADSPTVLWSYFGRLIIGGLVGMAGGFLLSRLMSQPRLVPNELASLVILAGVWAIFGMAEWLESEAGLMAAVATGLTVQGGSFPGIQQLRRFKESLTILSISLLFILLAASLRLEQLFAEGWRGVLAVLLIMFVVRPTTVFLSTWNSSLSWQEKAFIAWIGPRGIVAASVASLFSIALIEAGFDDGVRIIALTFLTIAMTVTIQGLSANAVSHLLGLTRNEQRKTLIVGAGPLGLVVAGLLQRYQRPVMLLDRNPAAVAQAQCLGFEAVQGNALDEDLLEEIGIEEVEVVLAATANTEVNALAVQLARENYAIQSAFPVLDLPEKGAGLKLLRLTGDRAAFGQPIDHHEWEHCLRQNQALHVQVEIPSGWNTQAASNVTLPESILTLARLRAGRLELAHSDQLWQSGDRIFLLVMDAAVSALEEVGWQSLERESIGSIECPEISHEGAHLE